MVEQGGFIIARLNACFKGSICRKYRLGFSR